MVAASLTGSLTSFVGDHGIYAVFALMVVSAVLPAASEITMLYAGAVASGAFASAHVAVFGSRISTGGWAFVAMAVAGVLGNLLGAALGWAVGSFGGRPFLERYGGWLHVTPAKLRRAERSFERWGSAAIPAGLALPVLRSFVAIPAGILRVPLRRFLALAVPGCAAFCFALAGAGWAVGRSWHSVRGDLRYVDVAIVTGAMLIAAYLVLRRRSSRLARRRAHDSAG